MQPQDQREKRTTYQAGLVGLVGLENHLFPGDQLPQLWSGLGFLGTPSYLELPGALGHLGHLEG